MKQFIVAIFLCVAFSALVNAAERKIAYDRGGKIFVADVEKKLNPRSGREMLVMTEKAVPVVNLGR